ncbi:uncharacterized protein [Panulirus ornatus]|uniref:uncharacterized protein n=1 Tax=Panulirus ornatus TaxID=150431 RepID=UPI003A83ADD4
MTATFERRHSASGGQRGATDVGRESPRGTRQWSPSRRRRRKCTVNFYHGYFHSLVRIITVPKEVMMTMMMMALVMALGVGTGVGEHPSTFLMVARDLAPPTAHNTPTAMAGCGLECFAAGVPNCLSFVWRPLSSPRASEGAIGCDSSQDGCGHNSGDGAKSALSADDGAKKGRCALLPCVPHPASLTHSPGARVYLRRGKSFVKFGSFKAPSSYEMACTFAFRLFNKVKLSFLEAERRCVLDGARLIAIKNAEEERVVQERMQPADAAYWIGVDDREKKGDWRLSDGSRPQYFNWDSGQPNNYQQNGTDQECVMHFRGAWNDNQCHEKLHFICEIRFLEL